MNASAYLHNQGWRGEGYSLDRTDRGLAKPLLVAHKTDLSGLGSKKNDFANQWWTAAFDKSLRDLGKEGRHVQSAPQAAKTARLQASLYSNFIRSEPLRGTISDGFTQVPIIESGKPDHPGPGTPKMATSAHKISRFGVLGVPSGEVIETVSIPQQSETFKKDKKKRKEVSAPGEDGSVLEAKVSKKKRDKKPKKEKSEKKEARKAERRQEQEERKAKKTQKRQERRLAAERKAEGTQAEVHDGVEDKKSKKRKRNEEIEGPATLRIDEKPRKKYKEYKESGAEDSGVVGTKEDQKPKAAASQEPAADFVPLNLPANENHISRGSKSIRKEAAKEIRARRKAEKAAKARERVAIKRAKQALELAGATATSSLPNPGRELRRPLHPESILALRESGQTVQLPGDPGDEDQVRFQLIKAFEYGPHQHAKTVLDRAAVQFQANELTNLKATSKKAKIKRENYKRKVKTEAKSWLDMRENTHLYKPDGSYIPPTDRGVTAEEIRAWRQSENEAQQRAVSEKKAEMARKAQEKVERRAAKLQRRRERLQRAEPGSISARGS